MNVQDPRIQQELKEGLGWLNLTAHNEAVFRSYIFLEERDEGILATAGCPWCCLAARTRKFTRSAGTPVSPICGKPWNTRTRSSIIC